MKKAGFIFILMGLSISIAYAQTLDLPTYYPSPFGSYARFQLKPRPDPPAMAQPACPNDGSMWGLIYMDESGRLMSCDWNGSDGIWRPAVSPWVHDATTDNVYLFYDDIDTDGTNAFVGIGTDTPADRLDLADSDGNIRLYDSNGETAHVLGSNGSILDGIILRTLANPGDGEPIFKVESSDQTERLRVEHNGAVKIYNVLEVDGAGGSYFTGNLGLGGETAPVNALDVSTAAVIGTGYAGTNAAPNNGLLVEGDVAIGKTAPTAGMKLDVNGNLQVNNTIFFEGGGNITDDGFNFSINHW